MPAVRSTPIPPLFLERMSRLLAAELPAFAAALEAGPCTGLRVNTLKVTVEEFEQIAPLPLGRPVDWCPTAFLVDGEQRPGRHPYHRAGLYYLQDPSAMAPAELLAPRPGERVLDLAAAPGGKTTHLAALMGGEGLLVANEIKSKRVGHLAQNVERWGAGNVVVTNETPEALADHFGAFFDRVLVDAPCSGEGMFRKDMGARADWSEQMIAGCATRQTNILRVAAKLVRAGGVLLYSTCTFAPEENEAVIARFLDESTDYEVIPLPLFPGFLPGRPDWLKVNSERTRMGRRSIAHLSRVDSLKGAVRLFPHRLAGEGHFACKLKRTRPDAGEIFDPPAASREVYLTNRLIGLWDQFAAQVLSSRLPLERLRLSGERLYLVPEGLPDLGRLRVVHPGVWLGTFRKDRFEPAHPLALYLNVDQAQNRLDLPAGDRRLAAYLRGEVLDAQGDPGWLLVSVDSFPLGWGKRVQGAVKNHYPRGWLERS